MFKRLAITTSDAVAARSLPTQGNGIGRGIEAGVAVGVWGTGWRKREGGGPKQPLLIRRRDEQPFAFAGLWEHWRGPEGEVETCTILTTEANAVLAPIHDRMPVILDPASYDRWLDPAQPRAEELLRPCPDEWLEAFPVSTRVNNVRNDAAELIAPMNPA